MAAERMAAMSQIWEEGGTFGRLLVATALAMEVVAILDDNPATRPSLIDGAFAANIGQISRAAAHGEISLDDGDIYIYQLQTQAVTNRIAEEKRQADAIRLADRLREQKRMEKEDLEQRKQEALEVIRRHNAEQQAKEERIAEEEERKTVGRGVSHCLKLFEEYARGVHFLGNPYSADFTDLHCADRHDWL